MTNTNTYLIQSIERKLNLSCMPLNIGDGLLHFNFLITKNYTMRITDNTHVDRTCNVAIYKHGGVFDYILISETSVHLVNIQRLLDAIEQSLLSLHTQLSNECADLQTFIELTRQ